MHLLPLPLSLPSTGTGRHQPTSTKASTDVLPAVIFVRGDIYIITFLVGSCKCGAATFCRQNFYSVDYQWVVAPIEFLGAANLPPKKNLLDPNDEHHGDFPSPITASILNTRNL